jgi:hypothetical protein
MYNVERETKIVFTVLETKGRNSKNIPYREGEKAARDPYRSSLSRGAESEQMKYHIDTAQ